MPFTALSISMSPDADGTKHRTEIITGKYHLFSVVVRNPNQAIEIRGEFGGSKNIDPVLLCPGFSNGDAAKIARTMGPTVGLYVVRGDSPLNKVAMEAMKREGFFS